MFSLASFNLTSFISEKFLQTLRLCSGMISRSLTRQNGMFHNFHCACFAYPCGKEPIENVWKGEDVLENKNLEGD